MKKSLLLRICFVWPTIALHGILASAQIQSSPELQQMYLHGQDYQRSGDWKDATQVFGQLQTLTPSDADVCYNLALSLFMLHQYEQAEQALLKYPDRSRLSAHWYELLAESQLRAEKQKKAMVTIRKALSAFPDSGGLYAIRGKCLEEGGKAKKAVREWKKGALKKNAPQRNLYELAKTYMAHAMYTDAILCGELMVNHPVADTSVVSETKKLIFSAYRLFYQQSGATGTRKRVRLEAFCDCTEQTNDIMKKLAPVVSDGITTENLAMLRIRFLMSWYNQKPIAPFPLYAYQDLMLREGWFDVYNEWLFGESEDALSHSAWLKFHAPEADSFSVWRNLHPFPGLNP